MTHFGDTREHLLATGENIILGKGYAAVGLSEILGTAGVPKGSFYHYFPSKEAFGVQMLERYFDNYDARLAELLVQAEGSARDRLLGYFQRWMHRHCECSSHMSCLAVKLAGEVSDLSEPMREALSRGMDRVMRRIADALREGAADGSIRTAGAPENMARSLYSLWIGASLLFKVQHDPAILDGALERTAELLAGRTE
ncbi:TetR/AcrR family transcriptional regulator [Paludibacterium paludis]|nr:TetR/AcrR family transcriptional regulator [Paludibacterium paludis]